MPKLQLLILLLSLLYCSCQFSQTSPQPIAELSDMHKVIVREVHQTSNYTYLLVLEGAAENWLALPKMDARVGDTYYYKNGFRMTDFESKELNRKFPVIYFLESISKTPEQIVMDSSANPHRIPKQDTAINPGTYRSDIRVRNENVKLEPANGGITISELLGNKEKYSGKMVRIKGKVTKYNASIMSRNWFHLQDGTEYSGKFDITGTTNLSFGLGDVITIEGKVTLNKDFGYGYSYELLIEDAITIDNQK
ncbi:MAG: hypothetical protein HXX13_06430 [Bacteroidetes bacterium]|nr:hypothetical protein [Bacteroidota bacterium]